jgi:hypothetical protein
MASETPKICLELRRMAAKSMRHEQAGNTLQATALVHEVFLRRVDVDGVSWEEKAEVLKISPQTVMRDWKMARAWLMAELAR